MLRINCYKFFKLLLYISFFVVIVFCFLSFKSGSNWNTIDSHLNQSYNDDEFIDDENEFVNLTLIKTNSTFKHCLNPSDGLELSILLRWHKRIHPKPCTDDITDIFLIRSSIFRNSLRLALRSTWAQDISFKIDKKEKIKSKRIFMIGSPALGFASPLIEKEHELYHDILQGYFEDKFKTCTHKVLLGMKFVKIHCPNVKRVYVMDDDTVVAPWNLFDSVKNLQPTFRDFGGYVFEKYGAVRDKNSRYYVSEENYNCTVYPPFPSGTMYFLSYRALVTMYSLAHNYWTHYLDDVFFGIMAELGNIHVTRFDGIGLGCQAFLQPTQSQIISACHGIEFANEQTSIWSEVCHFAVRSEIAKLINNVYCKKT